MSIFGRFVFCLYEDLYVSQAFCSSINGTIATQSILQGLGVGEEATTALAATMTWVLKGMNFSADVGVSSKASCG